MASLDDRLRSVPFFRALPAAELGAIGGLLKSRNVRKGAVLFREGDVADAMYLVDSGQLEVLRGKEKEPVAILGAGSVAGELAVLLGEPRSATLRAASSCRLWSLTRADLDGLLTAHPAIARELSAELSRRLVTTTKRLTHGEVTRYIAAFGDTAVPLADAIGRAGLRVAVLAAKDMRPDDLARRAGHRSGDLDDIVLAMPRSRTPLSVAALDLAQWVVSDAPLPGWVAARHNADRVAMVSDSSMPAVARLVTGRAVAVAFSSGGSKTVAHAGVVGALRDAGVAIDAVAGSSGGALVAMSVATEASTDTMVGYIRELAEQLRPRRWDMHLVPRSGIIKGRRLRDMFDRWLEGREFKDLAMPLYVVASDMLTGEEVVLNSGSLADALRASLSIPAAFDPWRHQNRLFIDGGVTNPLPAGPLRAAGYERIIASNVAGKDVDPTASPGDRLPSIVNVILRTVNLMEAEVIKAQLPLADTVIRPVVTASGSFDFSDIDGFITEGRAAVERQLPELERLGFIPRLDPTPASAAPARPATSRSSRARPAAKRGTPARR
jgi:NTE family protein